MLSQRLVENYRGFSEIARIESCVKIEYGVNWQIHEWIGALLLRFYIYFETVKDKWENRQMDGCLKDLYLLRHNRIQAIIWNSTEVYLLKLMPAT